MNKFFSKRVHFLAFILLFISIFVLIDTIFNEKNRISWISIESDMHFLEMHLASLDEDIGNRLYDYDMHMTQGSVLFSYRENLMKKDNKYIVLNASQIKWSENFAYKYSQDFKKNKIQKESCHGDFYRVIDMFYSNKNSFRNHKDSLILEKILDENNQELYEIVIKHELTKWERILWKNKKPYKQKINSTR